MKITYNKELQQLEIDGENDLIISENRVALTINSGGLSVVAKNIKTHLITEGTSIKIENRSEVLSEYTIAGYKNDPNGKWLELWLDGKEYTSAEQIYDETLEEFVYTGKPSPNYSCKRGKFERTYQDFFEESITDYEKIIGLKVSIDKDDEIVFTSKISENEKDLD